MPQRRERRSSASPSMPLWPIGTAIVLPVATLGVALIIAGWAAPGTVAHGFVHVFSYAVVIILITALMLILAGAKRGSRRLRRPMVWLSIVLSILVTVGILFTQHRAAALAPVIEKPALPPDIAD